MLEIAEASSPDVGSVALVWSRWNTKRLFPSTCCHLSSHLSLQKSGILETLLYNIAERISGFGYNPIDRESRSIEIDGLKTETAPDFAGAQTISLCLSFAICNRPFSLPESFREKCHFLLEQFLCPYPYRCCVPLRKLEETGQKCITKRFRCLSRQ